jgi:hypothetical protein
MRSVDYISCITCRKRSDVYFAHGAIQVYPCKKCCRLLGIIKRLIAKIRGK